MQVSIPVQEKQGSFTSLSAGANRFLAEDGLLNFKAIESFSRQVKTRQGDLKPLAIFVCTRNAKMVPYSASADKRGDLRYKSQRAVKVFVRKRLTDALANVQVLYTALPKEALTPSQWTDQQALLKAFKSHASKAEKSRAKVSKEKAGIRIDQEKAFDLACGALIEQLKTTGLKDTSFVEARGPFGSTLLVNLGNDMVVSVGKADMARFRAAKRALSKA